MVSIQNKTMAEIEARLHACDLQALSEALRDSDAVIAGSFPLQCVLDERWNGGDIDIFVNQSKAAPLHEYLSGHFSKTYDCKEHGIHPEYNYHKFPRVITYWVQYGEEKVDIASVYREHEDRDKSVYAHSKQLGVTHEGFEAINWDQLVVIQIIELYDDQDPYECIDAFDFDVCKVCYNGVYVQFMVPYDKVIDKRASYCDTHRDLANKDVAGRREEMRKQKYKDRGFTVVCEPHKFMTRGEKTKSANKR